MTRAGRVLIVALPCIGFMAQAGSLPVPLARAHAHNDYEHARPLLDALDHGFCSVEADIFLVDGQLLVAHDRRDVAPERTLQKLYLDPLRTRVRQHDGRVYPKGPNFTLLIDLKSSADPTYAVLREVLNDYSEMLTRFTPDKTEPGAVTVVLSGNRPLEMAEAEAERWVGIDARVPDLVKDLSPHLFPLVSDHWRRHFSWTGDGAMPGDQQAKLKRIVQQTHARGCRLRFWATPERPEVWAALHEAGVDLLNTDDLPGMRKFLLKSHGSMP